MNWPRLLSFPPCYLLATEGALRSDAETQANLTSYTCRWRWLHKQWTVGMGSVRTGDYCRMMSEISNPLCSKQTGAWTQRPIIKVTVPEALSQNVGWSFYLTRLKIMLPHFNFPQSGGNKSVQINVSSGLFSSLKVPASIINHVLLLMMARWKKKSPLSEWYQIGFCQRRDQSCSGGFCCYFIIIIIIIIF